MSPTITEERRGIALLLVLGTLVLSTVAAISLARVVLKARLGADAQVERERTDQLLDAAEPTILDWLQHHAGQAVLPPDAETPAFVVLDDTIALEERSCRITITAFDQCGMVGADLHPALAGVLSPHVLRQLEGVGSWQRSPGLDLLTEHDQVPVYPSAGIPTAIGGLVATHNPARQDQQASVNVNTAPLDLLRRLYDARGTGGLETVVESRTSGRVSSPGARQAPQTDARLPIPVGMSNAWAFRIDCTAGRSQRSWWAVYTDAGNNWQRVQRLVITE